MHLGADRLEHRRVRDLPERLRPGDLLVVNDTAVAPARFFAEREGTGGRVEGLFLEEIPDGNGAAWRVMLKNAGRCRPGGRLVLLDAESAASGLVLVLEDRQPDAGTWTARLDPPTATDVVLDRVGHVPLPPYIMRARAEHDLATEDERDREWYQTVYADATRRRSVAAPTAGLHFTPALLDAIGDTGAVRATVTLHVGVGTFRPISADTVEDHRMHCEHYEVPDATLAALRARRAHGGRVIAVGSTSVRTLESLPTPLPLSAPEGGPVVGDTSLLITPPYEFRHVDAMLTNFHLPRSSLLALVAAMTGLERLLAAYRVAIEEGYRFYSYGDAMLVLP